MMEKKIIMPRLPFYFVRHGETDWNKINKALCSQDDISLNETGLIQAANAAKKINSLGITKIYSSPLLRAEQTAQIINERLRLHLNFHKGLREISPENVVMAFAQILEPSHTILIVSHGEVYRVLLRLLNAHATVLNAKNGGLYFFSPSNSDSEEWLVTALNEQD